jgi:cytochrome c biogenesis protein CcmG, thiol:disulfide interchange protein DsbE
MATTNLPPYVPMRRYAAILAALALVAVLVVGLTQANGGSGSGKTDRKFDLEQAQRELAGAPPPLASLHDQASALLPGGPKAFRKRLASLEGYPVVVNKWASWCGPCRAEFPIFQQIATTRGKEIAFVGVNARDKRPAAERFAARYPAPYPSYEDPRERIARALKAPSNFPVTLFVDADGKTVFAHQGGYRSAAELSADIDEHLGT